MVLGHIPQPTRVQVGYAYTRWTITPVRNTPPTRTYTVKLIDYIYTIILIVSPPPLLLIKKQAGVQTREVMLQPTLEPDSTHRGCLPERQH